MLEIGSELLAGVAYGTRRQLARSLKRTGRALRYWRMRAAKPEAERRLPGRPGPTDEQWAAARAGVAAVLQEMGYGVGEAVVHKKLGQSVSLGLVRAVLRELKVEHRSRKSHVQESVRKHVQVLGRNVVWSVDATHLGRSPEGEKVMGEIVRDVASTTTLGLAVGPPPTSQEVVVLLDRALEATGEAPLVLASDNGPENKGEVNAWCARHGVVRLWNLPHTPQHNPWVEHGNGEIKAETGLGKRVVLDSALVAATAIVEALERIDGHRPRATRGWRTARQAYAALPAPDALVARQTFLLAVSCAIEQVLQDCKTPRERRAGEREAILETLERFELIIRTRGCTPQKSQKPEGVS